MRYNIQEPTYRLKKSGKNLWNYMEAVWNIMEEIWVRMEYKWMDGGTHLTLIGKIQEVNSQRMEESG
jgi:hypothetical protein